MFLLYINSSFSVMNRYSSAAQVGADGKACRQPEARPGAELELAARPAAGRRARRQTHVHGAELREVRRAVREAEIRGEVARR